MYSSPFDAIKKIASQHGIPGLFKGQCVTFLREATGYGVYFLVYEKLIQREITMKGISREQINPMNTVLYGATAGYAVSVCYDGHVHCAQPPLAVVGSDIPDRHD